MAELDHRAVERNRQVVTDMVAGILAKSLLRIASKAEGHNWLTRLLIEA